MLENNYEELKKVLFGEQKQGDAINSVVAVIVGKDIATSSTTACTTREDWLNAIRKYTEFVINNGVANRSNTIALLYGLEAVDAIYNEDINDFGCKQPYPDSPKCVFYLTGNSGNTYSLSDTESGEWLYASDIPETAIVEDEYVLRAKKLKDAIYPLIPVSVRRKFTGELGEWQAALLFAKEV